MALRRLHAGGWLRPHRIGCLLLVLVLLLVAALWMVRVTLDATLSVFNPTPPPVTGSPFDSVAPPAPAGSGSPTLDRITGRGGLLLVAIQNRQVPGVIEQRVPGPPSHRFSDYTGFDIALLELVAVDLGVDPDGIKMKPRSVGLTENMIKPRTRGGGYEADLLLGGYEITPQRRATVGIAGPYLTNPDYGFGLPPGDEVFRERVNNVLRKAINDGTWARLYAEHLGTPVPAPPTIG